MRIHVAFVLSAILAFPTPASGETSPPSPAGYRGVTLDDLRDRIHGGWVGMLIGGLEDPAPVETPGGR